MNLPHWLTPWRKRAPVALAPERKATPRSEPAWVWSYSTSAKPDTIQTVSAWVYACADLIATSLSALPVVLRQGDAVLSLSSDDPLATLLREPIPEVPWDQWLEEVGLYAILTGSCLIEKRRVNAYGPSERYPNLGKPAQLWPFGANAFKAKVDDLVRRQEIEYYEPKIGTDRDKLPPSEIVRVAYTRLGKRNEGLSKVEGSQGEINADRGAADWQTSSLKNRGVPDGIIKLKNHIGDTQETNLYNHIQDQWVGSRNAHRPVVLGADADWIDLAKTAVEMEMIEGRRFTRSAICATMGVPEVIFDVSGATYANLETALLSLSTRTVLPLAKRIISALNLGVCREFGSDLSLEIDVGAVDALLPILRARWEIAGKALDRGVPMEQVNSQLRLGLKPFRGAWDVGFVPSSVVPAESVTAGLSDADLGLTSEPSRRVA